MTTAPLSLTTASALAAGQRITAFLMVRGASKHPFKNGKRGHYLTLNLTDKTGNIIAKVWEVTPEIEAAAQPSTVVKVAGDVGEYQGALEITVTKIRIATPDEYTLADFVPATPKDVATLMAQLEAGIEHIQNHSLHALVQLVYGNLRPALMAAPCSEKFNHPYAGGLLEHTTEMLTLAETMLGLYPQANGDLVRAGILLANIGKVQSYSVVPFIAETQAHAEQGHILLGYEMVIRAQLELERTATTTPFVAAEVEPLKHILAAQSGRLEWGSPVRPNTLESEIVHCCEYASARVNARACATQN